LRIAEDKSVGGTATGIASSLATEVCGNLKLISPEMQEIYPFLGYPRGTSPAPLIAERISRLVEESSSCLEPLGTFSVYPLSKRTGHSMTVGDVTIRGDIAQYLEHADRVAVFLVTIGERISRHSSDLRRSGDAFAAWVVDAFGSWATEAAADALMERLRHHLGAEEALTLRYSPGYCGMEMSQQRKLFRLISADSIGVQLLPSLLMQPLKSISGLVGLGPKEGVLTFLSACDRCPQVGCHMRR